MGIVFPPNYSFLCNHFFLFYVYVFEFFCYNAIDAFISDAKEDDAANV